MQRRIFPFLLISLSSVAALSAACTANLQEGCLAGPCGPDSLAAASSAASSSGAGGMDGGAEGGLNSCEGMDPPATGDFPCDVFAVVHKRCNPCHTQPTMAGAPFPLLTFEDTQQLYGTVKIYKVMNGQIRSDAIPRMPLGADFTDPALLADLQILGDWLNNMCAPPVAEGMGCECPGTGCN